MTTPAPRTVWRQLIESDPEAVPYQTPEWLDCICRVGGHNDASRLYELPGGEQFVLPMVRLQGSSSPLARFASLPHAWGMGGVIASRALQPEDTAMIFDDLSRLPAVQISVRPNPRTGQAWAASRTPSIVAIPRRAHVIDLEGGFDKVWSTRFKSRTRTAVRKAERSGLVVERDTTGRLIPVFHELLCRSFDRWAAQQHEPRVLARWRGLRRDPLAKFEYIAKQLGDACRVWVAWIDGRPAASMIALQYGNVNDSRGAMNKELAAPVCANDLLQKLAIEEACEMGCRYYHLGESGTSEGLARYKERFGAQPYDYFEYRLERLPITRIDRNIRSLAKHMIGFKDVSAPAQAAAKP